VEEALLHSQVSINGQEQLSFLMIFSIRSLFITQPFSFCILTDYQKNQPSGKDVKYEYSCVKQLFLKLMMLAMKTTGNCFKSSLMN
jgi:hypothetical protein